MKSFFRNLFSRNGNYNITDFPQPPEPGEEYNGFLYDENLAHTEVPDPAEDAVAEPVKDDAEGKAVLESLRKLISESAQLVARYDTMANNAETREVKELCVTMAGDIIETLILSGCKPINPQPGDIFDNAVSLPTPLCWPQMAVVTRTVRMGVEYGDRVYIKAIVEIKQ